MYIEYVGALRGIRRRYQNLLGAENAGICELPDTGTRSQTRVLCKKQTLLIHLPSLLVFILCTQALFLLLFLPNTAKNNYLYSIYFLQHSTSKLEIA